jgi:hypothetical protein
MSVSCAAGRTTGRGRSEVVGSRGVVGPAQCSCKGAQGCCPARSLGPRWSGSLPDRGGRVDDSFHGNAAPCCSSSDFGPHSRLLFGVRGGQSSAAPSSCRGPTRRRSPSVKGSRRKPPARAHSWRGLGAQISALSQRMQCSASSHPRQWRRHRFRWAPWMGRLGRSSRSASSSESLSRFCCASGGAAPIHRKSAPMDGAAGAPTLLRANPFARGGVESWFCPSPESMCTGRHPP